MEIHREDRNTFVQSRCHKNATPWQTIRCSDNVSVPNIDTNIARKRAMLWLKFITFMSIRNIFFQEIKNMTIEASKKRSDNDNRV